MARVRTGIVLLSDHSGGFALHSPASRTHTGVCKTCLSVSLDDPTTRFLSRFDTFLKTPDVILAMTELSHAYGWSCRRKC